MTASHCVPLRPDAVAFQRDGDCVPLRPTRRRRGRGTRSRDAVGRRVNARQFKTRKGLP